MDVSTRICKVIDDSQTLEFVDNSMDEDVKQYWRFIKNLLIYIAFATTFLIVVTASRSSDAEDLASEIKILFSPISTVTDMATFWSFALSSLPSILFPDIAKPSSSTDALRIMTPHIYLVGAIRLRQHRTDPFECENGNLFKNWTLDCYTEFTSSTESRTKFGSASVSGLFTFTHLKAGASFSGAFADYPASGFQSDISSVKKDLERILATLKSSSWVDSGTRAVLLDFNLWNLETGVIAPTTLAIEFSSSGLVYSGVHVTALAPNSIYFTADKGLIIGHILILGFVVFYLVEEAREIFSSGFSEYKKDLWNFLDWANLGLLIASFVFRCLVWSSPVIGEVELKDPTFYYDARQIGVYLETAERIDGINSILILLKVMKFVEFLPYVWHLLVALKGNVTDYLVWNFVLFPSFIFAISVLFHGHFGLFCPSCGSLGSTVSFLARALIGDAEISELKVEGSDPTLPMAIAILLIQFASFGSLFAIVSYAIKNREIKIGGGVPPGFWQSIQNKIRRFSPWNKSSLKEAFKKVAEDPRSKPTSSNRQENLEIVKSMELLAGSVLSRIEEVSNDCQLSIALGILAQAREQVEEIRRSMQSFAPVRQE